MSHNVKLTLTNTCSADATVTITDAYGCDGPATHRVRAGKHVTHVVHAAGSDGWYDATVTSDHDAAYVRRFAGHIENGRPSVSDPAIITG
jgi:phospholipase C